MKDWIGNSKSGYIINGISRKQVHEREKHDFYATDPQSVKNFLKNYIKII